jgi:uncharacterized membrane protein
MLADAIAAYAHNMTTLLLAAVLFAEFILCGSGVDAPRVRLLSKFDLLYIGWKNGLKTAVLPTSNATPRVRRMIGLQLGLLLCLPLLASLMARGFG